MNIKSFAFIILVLTIFNSCKTEHVKSQENKLNYVARYIDSVTIIPSVAPEGSFRTITIINENPYFAGSNGNVFSIMDSLTNFETKIKYDTIKPHFRSSAFNGLTYFALSIGNPALLYKFEPYINVSPIKNSNTNTEFWLPDGYAFFDPPKYYTHFATLVYQEVHSKVFYDAMAFFDESNGIAMGDPTEDCLSIIITKDGGNTWHKISCNELPKTEEGEAAFAASNSNIAIVDSHAWLVTGGELSRVFHTPDMGKSWEVFNSPIVAGSQMTGIYSVDFYDEKHGIIIGGNWDDKKNNIANKAITTNGGITWQLVADGQEPGYKSCVQYVPNTQGKELFAVGSTGISFSNDSGQSWKNVSDEGYYAIRFVNENFAWLSGNNKIGKMILN